jgi:hypothetical protein
VNQQPFLGVEREQDVADWCWFDIIVHSMKGTGIALVDVKEWSLMDGDELVHVSGGPSPFALNVHVSRAVGAWWI